MTIDAFKEAILGISVTRFGGIGPAIIGAAGSDDTLVLDLKRNTALFAKLCGATDDESMQKRKRLAGEIEGQLQVLYAMNVISVEKTDQLIDAVHTLAA